MSYASANSYLVTCYTCRAELEAREAGWCACLHKERTLVCPHCLKCFCQAPFGYKKKFWAEAPQWLWDRKIAEHLPVRQFVNAPPDEVGRPLVLLVDDEPEIREVAIRVIEILGYGLVVAKNGEEGLELAARYQPELVLTDAMMPKLDGREMGLRIKQDPKTASAKVVVMTSLYKDPRYKHEALKKFQVDEYLAKPLSADALRAVLEKYLGSDGGQ